MKKKLLTSFIVLCCLFAGLFFFMSNKSGSNSLQVTELSQFVSEINVGQEFELKSLTDFEWDKVYIVPPYGDLSVLNDVKGIDRIQSSIKTSDSISLLIFVKGDTLTRFAEVPRNQGDFAFVTRKEFKVNEAVFVKKKSPAGTTLINKF
ncbi:hypothetical protein NV379_17415 [Paenibacillus sp. N1-5-1-14]|uniref:hypothetical protein n=1 Tax=Paenibacillus radicibacter TaxID=2972488 RepID=UPI002158B6E2|nr:hypothetical protein [Paenibacillus radicibacter]MCR8644436.1 hypothetical protein [Paenibacillus radicibacter]